MTPAGRFKAEYRTSILRIPIWMSCYNDYGWNGENIAKTYSTEEKAKEAAEHFCIERAEDERLKAKVAAYTPLEFTCTQLTVKD